MYPARLSPKKIFGIDFLGALLSATLHFGLLAPFDHLFGLPASIVYALGGMAFFFACFSGFQYADSYQDRLATPRTRLKTISLLNTAYCLLSLGLLIYYRSDITTLGWGYFLAEIVIVGLLARLEWLTGR